MSVQHKTKTGGTWVAEKKTSIPGVGSFLGCLSVTYNRSRHSTRLGSREFVWATFVISQRCMQVFLVFLFMSTKYLADEVLSGFKLGKFGTQLKVRVYDSTLFQVSLCGHA